MNNDAILNTIIATTVYSTLSTIITNSNIKDIINNNGRLLLLLLLTYILYKFTIQYHDRWYYSIRNKIYKSYSHTIYISCTQALSQYGHRYTTEGQYFNEVLFYMNKKCSH